MGRRDIKQFVVSNTDEAADFTEAEIEALIYKVANWFTQKECDRQYVDPVQAAKDKIRECLKGETEAGDLWRNCPKEFAARVRAKCNYDMVMDRGIPSARVKVREGRALDPKAAEGAKTITGMQPALVDFDQELYRRQVEGDILKEYPELDNPASKPLVRTISMYHAEREKIDRQLVLGVSDSKRDLLLESLRKLSVMTETALQQLGIHPNQIKKNVDKRTASSVADLVQMVEGDEDYRRREKVWALQLALQLWWMSEHPNGQKTGPQLSDFEIWHMTRSRPVKFRCRHGEDYTVVEGFEPRDLFDLLIKEGVLVEEPVIPGLVPSKELTGLMDYFTQEGTDGDNGTESGGGERAAPAADAPSGQ